MGTSQREMVKEGTQEQKKKASSSMGKRGGQARGWDTEEGRQGPEGLELTALLALGAARSLGRFR